MDLKGMVALVTGGNGGLGQRICHALAKEGAHIAVMYARSRDQAESVAAELASRYQVKAQAFACDITDDAAVDRLIQEVTRAFGRLDILVNDAAYNLSIPFGDLDSLTMEVWDRIRSTPNPAAARPRPLIEARTWTWSVMPMPHALARPSIGRFTASDRP